MTTTTAQPAPAAAVTGADPVLAVRDLRVRHRLDGREVVRDLGFELRPGQVVGIVGESGSGKTMTCRAALGILPEPFTISGGSVRVAGADLAAVSAAELTALRGSTISAVFQDPASYLNPSIPVGAQLAEVLVVKTGARRRDARRRAVDLLAAVHLADPRDVYRQYPFELSGGMLQRVLIADEATTALDVTVQAEILDLLAELRDRTGLALVLVSHDLAVVAQLCDEVLVLRDGEVVEQGPVGQVLHEPRHPYTRLLVDEHERYGLDAFGPAGIPEDRG
jgi:ABC-type dipeptide/oligopeptide/nickel transport system ATPase component